jgi:hypothetical protein
MFLIHSLHILSTYDAHSAREYGFAFSSWPPAAAVSLVDHEYGSGSILKFLTHTWTSDPKRGCATTRQSRQQVRQRE